jgi:chemotaxis protein methyltransferase CheR
MNDVEFTFLRELLHRKSGLSLTPEKRYLVESRLSTLCRRKNIATISELATKVRQGDADLTIAVIEAMTTNETLFFRDTLPFKQFSEVMLPHMLKERAAERSLRIWSAAASSGQEPYSMAMILDDMADKMPGWRIEILATDISLEILEKAKAGVYTQFEMQRGLPVQQLLKHFTQEGDKWRISDRLRRMVTFKPMNLIEPSHGLGQFDIIFCRNVLIYFDLPTKAQVLGMLGRHLKPDGFLSLGAAETVIGITDAFSMDRENRGVYRPAPKGAAGMAPPSRPPVAAPAAAAVPARPAAASAPASPAPLSEPLRALGQWRR